MGGSFIDLRSDTITIPTRDMLERVPPAVMGDSLRDEDPTVNLLQDRSAGLFGKEAGLDRKSTRLNSSHSQQSRMPSSA